MFGPRELPEVTLDNILDFVQQPGESVTASTLDVNLHLTGTDPRVSVRHGEERRVVELPSNNSLVYFGDLLNVPTAFLKRIPHELAEDILNRLLHQKDGQVVISYDNDMQQLTGVHEATRQTVSLDSLVGIVRDVVGPEGIILDWWSEPTEFRLDVVSPFDGAAVGGDRSVGDLTHGGLRVVQDVKRNLAPSVSKLMYRLVCTNGMEVADATAKVDARGTSIDELLDDLEIVARRLYAEVETDINHFYDLRNRTVANPEQALLRVARENGLSERVTLNLLEVAPELLPEGDVTEFDVANAFTNFALSPHMAQGTRRRLERIGGVLVDEHVARCNHCSARLI